MNGQIDQVSDTAFMAAAYRAIETNRSDAIFHDPLASKLAGNKGKQIIDKLPKSALIGGWSVVIRTRIIDDFILDAIAGGVDTVLNLGSGLDTRPYRMNIPKETRWIEVDYPHIIELKEARILGERPRCELSRVKLDFADTIARRQLIEEVGASSKNVLVLTEAVTPYLSESEVRALGKELRSNNAMVYWVLDYFSPSSYKYRRRSGMSKSMESAPFLFEPDNYFDFFSKIGWKPKEIKYFAIEAERLGRPAPFPFLKRFVISVAEFFSSIEHRREMKEYAGFVLFEPDFTHQILESGIKSRES